jgi:hypothetical protein
MRAFLNFMTIFVPQSPVLIVISKDFGGFDLLKLPCELGNPNRTWLLPVLSRDGLYRFFGLT